MTLFLFALGFIRAARGNDQRAPPVEVVHVRYDLLLVRSGERHLAATALAYALPRLAVRHAPEAQTRNDRQQDGASTGNHRGEQH